MHLLGCAHMIASPSCLCLQEQRARDPNRFSLSRGGSVPEFSTIAGRSSAERMEVESFSVLRGCQKILVIKTWAQAILEFRQKYPKRSLLVIVTPDATCKKAGLTAFRIYVVSQRSSAPKQLVLCYFRRCYRYRALWPGKRFDGRNKPVETALPWSVDSAGRRIPDRRNRSPHCGRRQFHTAQIEIRPNGENSANAQTLPSEGGAGIICLLESAQRRGSRE